MGAGIHSTSLPSERGIFRLSGNLELVDIQIFRDRLFSPACGCQLLRELYAPGPQLQVSLLYICRPARRHEPALFSSLFIETLPQLNQIPVRPPGRSSSQASQRPQRWRSGEPGRLGFTSTRKYLRLTLYNHCRTLLLRCALTVGLNRAIHATNEEYDQSNQEKNQAVKY